MDIYSSHECNGTTAVHEKGCGNTALTPNERSREV
jgi:hypothetical protein